MIPSLGIILTDKCNFNCVYCPPYGENIVRSKSLCNLQSLQYLIEVATKYGVQVIRFTGGEPLLQPERLELLLHKACICGFKKILLNTNGYTLIKNIDWLKKYKESVLLKISLDTLDCGIFNKIVRKPNLMLEPVLNGIDAASSEGFNIEINSVANKYNYYDLNNIVQYCENKNLNLKILDLFDFGGKVINYKEIYVNIDSFIVEMQRKYKKMSSERLPGQRGIEMKKFQLTHNRHLLIVCHKGEFSSSKYYTSNCNECENFPCDTGKFQIPVRADGLMKTCRLLKYDGINISDLSEDKINEAFLKILKEFEQPKII